MFQRSSVIAGIAIGAISAAGVFAASEQSEPTNQVDATASFQAGPAPTSMPTPTRRPAPTLRPLPTPTPAPLDFDHEDPEIVASWQEALNDAGIKLSVDGVWGRNTESATLSVQRDLGVPQTGLIDETTVLALDNYLTRQATRSPPTPTPAPASRCNYDPCLPPASDYDCAGGSGDGPAYTGRVRVIGADIYGLDRDGDGWGCERS